MSVYVIAGKKPKMGHLRHNKIALFLIQSLSEIVGITEMVVTWPIFHFFEKFKLYFKLYEPYFLFNTTEACQMHVIIIYKVENRWSSLGKKWSSLGTL